MCGSEIRPESNGFSFRDGGVLCPACFAKTAGSIPIGVASLRILRNLQVRPVATFARLQPDPEALREAEHIMVGYVQHLLERRLRSTGFLDAVRGLRAAADASAR
jgi:recombinational DNA repair protein (RecF pathway)